MVFQPEVGIESVVAQFDMTGVDERCEAVVFDGLLDNVNVPRSPLEFGDLLQRPFELFVEQLHCTPPIVPTSPSLPEPPRFRVFDLVHRTLTTESTRR